MANTKQNRYLAILHITSSLFTFTYYFKIGKNLSNLADFWRRRRDSFSAEKPARGSDSPPDCHSLPLASNPFPLNSAKAKTAFTGGFHFGGEGGIRTLETLLTPTRFPIVRARPATRLLHMPYPAIIPQYFYFCK